MKIVYFLAGLSLIVLLAACKVVESAGDVAQGRQALLEGKYQLALDYFWDADQVDPYYTYGAELREGVLSFLGRAQYLTGNYAQARQTLEKDLSRQQERQCRTAIPWTYPVSAGGPTGGAEEYPARHEGNL